MNMVKTDCMKLEIEEEGTRQGGVQKRRKGEGMKEEQEQQAQKREEGRKNDQETAKLEKGKSIASRL